MKLEIFPRTIFEKLSNIEFHEKYFQWKRSCCVRGDGQTDGQTDVTKLIVAFRNFPHAPKNLP
jgi:hypothetical protein